MGNHGSTPATKTSSASPPTQSCCCCCLPSLQKLTECCRRRRLSVDPDEENASGQNDDGDDQSLLNDFNGAKAEEEGNDSGPNEDDHQSLLNDFIEAKTEEEKDEDKEGYAFGQTEEDKSLLNVCNEAKVEQDDGEEEEEDVSSSQNDGGDQSLSNAFNEKKVEKEEEDNDQSQLNAFNEAEAKEKEEEEEEEEVVFVEVSTGKWVKHYHSLHKMLLVGEGDFSFSSSLATAFGTASNMIATSLDSKDFLIENYAKAMWNLKNLQSMGCRIVHGFDATKFAHYEWLGGIQFDRIVYNFPFAGFFKGMSLSREQKLEKHRRLVSLFLRNAKELIHVEGEIHITHKTNSFHIEWNLESIASSHGLRLIEAAEFNRFDYPRYNTKRGFGGDENFDCRPAKTYKFGLKK